jgi:hypothetical protein
MLFSGKADATAVAIAVALGEAGVVVGDARWKKVKELITKAKAATTNAAAIRSFGHRGALIWRTASDSFFRPLRFSLSGTCGLPRLSL